MGADYQKIPEQGKKLKQMLQGAKTVRVTSPSGTDFTFSVGRRPIFVDDGIMTEERAKSHLALTRFVSLPSGTVPLRRSKLPRTERWLFPRLGANTSP